MIYLHLVSEPDRWLAVSETGAAVAQQALSIGSVEAWAEAYGELAMACRFRFPKMDAGELAAAADILAGGILFAAKTRGLAMPADWHEGQDHALRRAVWGELIERRIESIDAYRQAFADLDNAEISAMLERVSAEMRALSRRAAMHVIRSDGPA